MRKILGLLNCDRVNENLSGQFGEYPDMFGKVFYEQASDIEWKVYNVQNFEYPEDIDEVDAYVIGGCASSSYDDKEWIHRLGDFIKELNAAKKKTIGICFGHQMVAQVLGGKVEKSDKGWGIGMHTVELNEKGKDFVGHEDTVNIFSTHQDQVVIPAEGSETLGGNAFCPIGVSKIGNHIFTIQGHIEMEKEYGRGLINLRRHLYGEELYQQALDSLEKQNDRGLITQWIIDFIWEK